MTPEKMRAAFTAATTRIHESLGPESMGVQPSRMNPKATNPSTVEVARHVLWMCQEGPRLLEEGRLSKANRWLGFVQAALWIVIGASIEELKDTNRSDEPANLARHLGDSLGRTIEELAMSNASYLELVGQLDANVSMTETLYAPNPVDPAVLEQCLATARKLQNFIRHLNGDVVTTQAGEAADQLIRRIERMLRPEET